MNISEFEKNNPWKELTDKIKTNNYTLLSNDHVLEKDYSVIEKFNQKQSELFKFRLSMMPAHFTGNILHSKVVLLAANPGYDEEEEKDFYHNPVFIKERVEDLSFSNNYFLSENQEREKASPYWYKKLRWLIDAVNFEQVSKNIALLQHNPYHSSNYREIAKTYFKEVDFKNYIPSQKFGFDILKYCIDNDKDIIITRRKESWIKAVPELKEHELKGKVFTLINYQNPSVSPNNFTQINGFQKIVQILKQKTYE